MSSIEILYVYISDYRNIKDQGFSFSSQYKISRHENTEKFFIDINDFFSPEFFNGKNEENESLGIITNITGIVGQNGSGKSSILEFLTDCFRFGDTFNPLRMIEKDIIIIREKVSDQDNLILFHKGKLKEIKTPQKSTEIDFENIQSYSLYRENKNLANFIVPIYYSTSMHDRVTLLGTKEYEVVNVSDLHCYYETNVPMNTDQSASKSYKRIPSPSNFKYEDTQRQLRFIGANKIRNFVDLSFSKPTSFGLSFSQSYTIGNFKNLIELVIERFPPKNDFQFFQQLFCVSLAQRFVIPEDKDFKQNEIKTNYQKDFENALANKDNIFDATIFFLKNHIFIKYPTEVYVSVFDKYIVEYDYRVREKIILLSFLKVKLTPDNFINGEHSNYLSNFMHFPKGQRFFNPFSFQIKVDLGSELVKFYIGQLCGDFTPDFIEFTWSSLSSGQVAYLNLFSRFFDGFVTFFNSLENYKNVRQVSDLKNILIIIDEGEVYFHPEWQRQYVKSIIKFFKELCPDMHIQIIIASNSPFITSDLPRSSLIFLKRGENNACVVSPNEDHEETFGANIHRLFKDAFYLQSGFIGEFAKDQIQFVINFLNAPYVEEVLNQNNQLKLVRNIIQNLGDPIIKEKLIEMWDAKFEKFNDTY